MVGQGPRGGEDGQGPLGVLHDLVVGWERADDVAGQDGFPRESWQGLVGLLRAAHHVKAVAHKALPDAGSSVSFT